MSAAEKVKNEGNAMFKKGHYLEAVELYTKAEELLTDDETKLKLVILCNRAQAQIKLENYGLALADGEAAIALDDTYVKAYYRRGAAHYAMQKYKLARADFRKVVQLKPSDRDARAKYKQCDAAFKKEMFEKAIASEHTKSSFEQVDIDSIVVPDSYDGVALVDGQMTLEFITDMMERFKNQKTIHIKYCYQILRAVGALLRKLPSLVHIPLSGDQQITVCGDTHGQYYDVMNLFSLNGLPSETNPYLFNGDYVDRGSFSSEVALTFLCYKLLYPKHFHMSRGNHETTSMNRMYGFEGEVVHKYDMEAMNMFTEVFNALPLSHVIANRVYVVHGGLFSQDNVSLEDIAKINRFSQPPDSGLMSDMMWSDPQPQLGRGPSKRGVGLGFGPDITKAFLEYNNLDLLVRSHEVKPEGYLVEADGKCITVFSAPNYCDSMGNKGAYIIFKEDGKPDIKQFTHVPHPNVPPMAYSRGIGGMF